jgi:hypothetical protein
VTDTELFLRAFGLLMLLCVWVITRSFVKHMRATRRNRHVIREKPASDPRQWSQTYMDSLKQGRF